LGTNKTFYCLKTGDKLKLIKNYLKSTSLTYQDFTDLLVSLSHGSSFEELSAMATVLSFYPEYRRKLPTSIVNRLFDHVCGWAETDVTCTFPADDLLADWKNWQKLLSDFSIDSNIHKRRASLVILTLPLRQSDDSRLAEIALINVEKLKSEKDILITKAVSWVLRAMIKFHQSTVSDYLAKNKDSLPKIAVREVNSKLLTGKKYVKKRQ
jgi:3-methyladenine DNA glycosylase AlkD